MTTPGQLFRRCGMALFGPDPGYKVPFGLALGIKTDSIDGMAKDEKRIPPGVWRDVRRLLLDHYEECGNLIGDFHEAATATFEGEAIPPSSGTITIDPARTTNAGGSFPVDTSQAARKR